MPYPLPELLPRYNPPSYYPRHFTQPVLPRGLVSGYPAVKLSQAGDEQLVGPYVATIAIRVAGNPRLEGVPPTWDRRVQYARPQAAGSGDQHVYRARFFGHKVGVKRRR